MTGTPISTENCHLPQTTSFECCCISPGFTRGCTIVGVIVMVFTQPMRTKPIYSRTFVKSIHIRFTLRSRATASTISREMAIVIASPSPSLRTSSPHSFSANAASSTRRFVTRARSASVQRTTACTAALPSGAATVSYVFSSCMCAANPGVPGVPDGPAEPKPKLSRVVGDALPPPSGELGAADSPSQPLARFVRLCGDAVISPSART